MTYKDYASRLEELNVSISEFLKDVESEGFITHDSRFLLDYLYSMFVDSWYFFVNRD